mgnify:CR=1 FL=1
MGRRFFYGWYLKCQDSGQTLAVIPAYPLRREEVNPLKNDTVSRYTFWEKISHCPPPSNRSRSGMYSSVGRKALGWQWMFLGCAYRAGCILDL